MSSVKEVALKRSCPVCHYITREVYEKTTHELSVKGGQVVSYVYQSTITGIGRHKFEDFRTGNWHFITCPKCGIVLNADICEKEMTVDEALFED